MDIYKDGIIQLDGCSNKTYERGIFGNGTNPETRIVEYEKISEYIDAFKTLGLNIVLTSGTFDLTHIGHSRYLDKAHEFGDILIVGVDSDEKVRKRKGPNRPVVPEDERALMIASLRSADVVTIKSPDEPRWGLIKTVKPNTLIVTQETYTEDELRQLCEFCGQVICLEPQATTSTSAKIRKLQIDWTNKLIDPIEEILIQNNASPELRKKIGDLLLNLKNG